MSSSACETWMRLSDREAIGDALSDEEQSLLRSHPSSCAACGSEAAGWRRLRRALDEGRVDDAGDANLMDRVLADHVHAPPRASAPAPTKRPKARGRGLSTLGVAAAALAVAAAAVIYVRRGGRTTEPKPGVSASLMQPSVAEVTFAAGGVELASPASVTSVAGTVLSDGATVRTTTGTACLRIEPGVRVCLDRETEIVLADRVLAHRRLDLTRGRVVATLDPQPIGALFTVTTVRDTAVTAHGTIFAVETHDDAVVVRVDEGAVDVKDAKRTRKLTAHESLGIGETGSRPMTDVEEALDRTLARAGELWGGGPRSTLSIDSNEPGTLVTVDGLSVGVAPVSMLVTPGEHTVRAGDGEGETFQVNEGEGWSRTPSPPPAPTSGHRLHGASSRARSLRATTDRFGAERATAAELLSEARDLRAGGHSADAAVAYRELEAQYPGSPEAHASFVLLGDVELANLGDASGALRSFDAYLRRPGELTQEARYGRIRALRALGRSTDERKAIEDFVATYPASVQVRSLQSRLEELRKP
jgi:hypothetical protein